MSWSFDAGSREAMYDYNRGYYEGSKNFDCRFVKNGYYVKGWKAGKARWLRRKPKRAGFEETRAFTMGRMGVNKNAPMMII
jgi:hypothetical protein